MQIRFLKELTRYNLQELSNIFDVKNEVYFLKELLDKGVIKRRGELYSIVFVGFIVYKETIAFVFPKYCRNLDNKSMKMIVQLLYEYSKYENLQEEEIRSLGNTDGNTSNIISLAMSIFDDYNTKHLYYREKIEYVLDGEEGIEWERTIDELNPIIQNEQILYSNFITRNYIRDDSLTITKIHKYILNMCFEILSSIGIENIFTYNFRKFELYNDELGDRYYMKGEVEREEMIQFNDEKSETLNLMNQFLNHDSMDYSEYSLTIFGTSYFNIVWEKVCAFVFDDKYVEYALNRIIDKPKWTFKDIKPLEANKTLIPDIVGTLTKDGYKYFYILDGKYYNFSYKNINKLPGTEDITKQYLYEKALIKYFNNQDYNLIINGFLFPSQEEVSIDIGEVSIDFISEITLMDISLFLISDKKVYEYYIKRKRFNNEEKLEILHLKGI